MRSRSRHIAALLSAPRRHMREPAWAHLPDRDLLDVRLCDLGNAHRRVDAGRARDPHQRRTGATQPAIPPRVLAFGRMVFARRCGGRGDSVLSGAPAADEARAAPDAGGVEGGTRQWCLRILRHEVGHAIDNAYRLHRRQRWRGTVRQLDPALPGSSYSPKPYSETSCCTSIASSEQSHPSEDFAESFAVWLRAGVALAARYAGWPASRKLRCVDELMKRLSDTAPAVRRGNVSIRSPS